MWSFIDFGSVRAFATILSSNIQSWNANPRCRSIRFRNTGDEVVTIRYSSGVEETLTTDQNLVLGGYPNVFRTENFSILFAGGGTNPRLLVVQDIQRSLHYEVFLSFQDMLNRVNPFNRGQANQICNEK